MTRLGDLLDFGQLFKGFSHNEFAQISHILRQFLSRCQNLIIFVVKSFLGNFYRHFAIFLVTLGAKEGVKKQEVINLPSDCD